MKTMKQIKTKAYNYLCRVNILLLVLKTENVLRISCEFGNKNFIS